MYKETLKVQKEDGSVGKGNGHQAWPSSPPRTQIVEEEN